MKLDNIALARYFAFIDTNDLNPRGAASFLDIVSAVVERYHFARFPQKPEDFDGEKGVVFGGGRAKDFNILQIVVHNNAVYVDASSSTTDSEKLLKEMLVWLSKDHKLTFQPEMITRCTYVSQLSFHSDIMKHAMAAPLVNAAARLAKRVPEYYKQPLGYQPVGIVIGFDPQTVKSGPSPFTIERRANTLFDENKFFSSSPLPTEEHIKLLEDLESELS